MPSRRQFISETIKITGAIAASPCIMALIESCEFDKGILSQPQGITIEYDLNNDSELAELKEGYGVQCSDNRVNLGIPYFIIRLSSYVKPKPDPENQYVCFSSLCTHLSCFGKDLWVQKLKAVIVCNCHGSQYDGNNNAKVIQGPAEKPLKKFPARFNPETKILAIDF